MNTRVGFNEHTYSFAINIDNGHPSVSGRTGKWNKVIVGSRNALGQPTCTRHKEIIITEDNKHY